MARKEIQLKEVKEGQEDHLGHRKKTATPIAENPKDKIIIAEAKAIALLATEGVIIYRAPLKTLA